MPGNTSTVIFDLVAQLSEMAENVERQRMHCPKDSPEDARLAAARKALTVSDGCGWLTSNRSPPGEPGKFC